MAAVITQVFPDEFHLITLDQLLGAISQLNPHVNIKAIVIGLMDRLSTYAAREAESDEPQDRQKSEEEAATALIEKLKISKETKEVAAKPEDTKAGQTNGNAVNGDGSSSNAVQSSQDRQDKPEPKEEINGLKDVESAPRKRGIPENVKLYEIFYDQVTHLVSAQRLHIQDTIALLVSLSNLALYVQTTPIII